MNRKKIKNEALTRSGNKCEICGQNDKHNNIPLVLQLDHIDGNNKNNQVDNLRILCPNCHTQQPTSCRNKNKQTVIKLYKEELQELVDSSKSLHEILIKLNLNASGASYEVLRTKIYECEIACSYIHQDKIKVIERKKFDPLHGMKQKITWPSIEEMRALLENLPVSRLAEQLGVSGVAVHKFCKKRGIATKPRGYWEKRKRRESNSHVIPITVSPPS
jgi:hypothetical protein